MTNDTGWALREQVWVTLIDLDDDLRMTSYLIQRQPNELHKAFPQNPEHYSFVLTFIHSTVLVNGEKAEIDEHFRRGLRHLTNAALMAPEPAIGSTVTTEAGPPEEWFA